MAKKKTKKEERKVLGFIMLDADSVELGNPLFIKTEKELEDIVCEVMNEEVEENRSQSYLDDLFLDRVFAIFSDTEKTEPVKISIQYVANLVIDIPK